MTILVTGANGQLGWEILQLAKTRKLSVVGFDRRQLDITDPAQVQSRIHDVKPSLVINAAAYTAVDRAEQEQGQAFAVNRDAVEHLAASCQRQNIALFHVSTDYVFDGTKGSPYTENDTTNPINVYGRSKLAGEQMLRATLPRHIILRTSWVFGCHGNNFVQTVLRLARSGGPLRIVDDQLGAPTSTRSLAAHLLGLAENYLREGELPWGSYHFSGKPYATWYDFAEEIIQQALSLGLINPVSVTPSKSHELQLVAPRPKDTRLASLHPGTMHCLDQADWRLDLQRLLASLTKAPKSSLPLPDPEVP